MNSIDKINFDFSMENETFARDLYLRWDSAISDRLENAADQVLSMSAVSGLHFEIDLLEINIGYLAETEFYDKFPEIFREKLTEAITASIYGNLPQAKAAIRISETKHALDLLCDFLLSGYIPSDALYLYRSIGGLFLSVLRSNSRELEQFLHTYGHYSGLRQRLVYQLDDPELEKGVDLLAPTQSRFICSYVYMLKARYKALEQPEVSRSEYRYAIWMVIYSYLLCNSGSYFNRRNFLVQTMCSLAANMNTELETIIDIITAELQNLIEGITIVPELLVMLRQIRADMIPNDTEVISTDIRALYESLTLLFKENKATSPHIVYLLTLVLEKENTCLRFVSLLKEEEIRRLTSIIFPQHSSFIINYAKELDNCHEKGVFEGKTGGNFSKIKWAVMFPLLLENRGTGFNRKYYVASVLSKIAAHFNITIYDMLSLIIKNTYSNEIDAQLFDIFIALKKSLEPETAEPWKTDKKVNIIDELTKKLHQQDKLSETQKQYILARFSRGELLSALIGKLLESHCTFLATELFAEESDFIISYSSSLSNAKKRHWLQGKSSGEFDRIKWIFIFTVLSSDNRGSLDRRQFVNRTLRSIAAHYNLDYGELLIYFIGSIDIMPEALHSIISSLFEEEQEHTILQKSTSISHKEREKLLQNIIPRQSSFILEAIGLLNKYFRATGFPMNISAEYIERLIWKTVFSSMLVTNIKSFDRTRFITWIIERISTLFRSSSVDIGNKLLTYLKNNEINAGKTLYRILEINYGRNSVLTSTDSSDNKNDNNIKPLHENNIRDKTTGHTVYINNAGIVLLSPYLPRLFSILELTGEGGFKDLNCQIKAVFLMRYAVFGTTDFPENEMELDKIMTGIDLDTPIPRYIELTAEEKETVDSMLRGVMAHWDKLKNSYVETLREAFLQREGRLEDVSDHLELTVSLKAYDMLLDSLPWSYSTIKYSWMKKPIHVKWR